MSYFFGPPVKVEECPITMVHGMRFGRGDPWYKIAAIVQSGRLFPPAGWKEGVNPELAVWQHMVADVPKGRPSYVTMSGPIPVIDCKGYQSAFPGLLDGIEMGRSRVRVGLMSDAGRDLSNWFFAVNTDRIGMEIVTTWEVDRATYQELCNDNYGGHSIYRYRGNIYVMPQPLPLKALTKISIAPTQWWDDKVASLRTSLDEKGFGRVQIVQMQDG